jgi:hypothetical protein
VAGNVTGTWTTTAFFPALAAASQNGIPLPAVDHAGARGGDVLRCSVEDTAGKDQPQGRDDESRAPAKKDRDQRKKNDHGCCRHPRIPLSEKQRFRRLVECGENRKVRFRVAAKEIEDARPTRIDAGREGRPRDRSLRRHGRTQRFVGPLLAQTGQVGELPLVHPLLGQPGVDPVKPEDDDALLGGERGGDEGQEEDRENATGHHRRA